MKAKSDYIFLGILGLITAITIIGVIVNGIQLTVTNYIAFAAWLTALFIKLSKNKLGRYAIGILLILGTFNICNFLPGTTWMNFGFGNTVLLQFNPIIFIILAAWYFVNKRVIKVVYSKVFKDSAEEEAIRHQKMIEFYFEKFKDCSEAELEAIHANMSNYPDEAQTALRKLNRLKL